LIPGVGPKTVERLAGMRIATVADLAKTPSAELERVFGPRNGRSLHRRANGYDDRSVETERVRKSESRETTFAHDVDDPAVLRETLDRLVADLCRNLESGGHRGRTVTLKIRLRPFRTFTRSRTIDQPTADRAVVGAVARELLDNFEADAPVRLLGVGLASFEHETGDPEQEEARPQLDLV
jgi:DNA polymerase-4